MKNSLLATSLLCCLLILGGEAEGQGFNKAGRSSLQFLKIGVGARQTAIGEAGISVVQDANAAFWNPAAVTGVRSVEASFSYDRWFADLNYIAGAMAVKWPDVGVFALSYSSLGYGDIPEALATAESGSSDTRTGATFTGNDMLLGLTYARQFTDQLSIGITAKLVREKLFEYAVSTYAFDVGTFYDTGFRGIRFAMSAQNFSKSVNFLAVSDRPEGYDVPLMFRIGVSVDLVRAGNAFIDAGESHALTIAAESVNSNDFGERWHVGTEYTFAGFLSLRAGYRFNYEEGNASFGIGVQKDLAGATVRVDYSYVSYQYLQSPHRVSVSVGF